MFSARVDDVNKVEPISRRIALGFIKSKFYTWENSNRMSTEPKMSVLNKQNKKQNNNVNVNGDVVKYFYYYVATNEMRLVTKKAFLKGDYPVIGDDLSKIKIVGLAFGNSKKRLKYLLHCVGSFRNEGLVKDCFDAGAFFMDCIKMMAKLKRFGEESQKFMDLKIILQVVSIFLRLKNMCETGLNISDLVAAIIDIYSAITNCLDKFRPQMLEELCLSTISMFLPKDLFEIIKRMNTFSSAKLCDDITGIHQLISLVIKAVCFILDLLPKSKFVQSIKDYLIGLGEFSTHAQLYQMSKIINEEKIGEKITRVAFRVKIKEFNKTIKHDVFRQWSRKSAAVMAVYLDFLKLVKRIDAYEQCSRQEPIGIIFQGPPGCGKSRAMNAVVQACPWSKYVHIIKDVNDGKDFYDMYENETIFYMDDVGQQGISQWRSFINMISEVKYPLDCARAENKDTKFFNSEVVLATTNEFMNLSGLVRTDGIRELPALWRRCVVLDFSRVKFNGSYTGCATWKSYNLSDGKFEDGFPIHFRNELEFKNLSNVFQFSDTNEDISFYSWICKIIKAFKDVNAKRLVTNNLSESQLDLIRENSGFLTEGIFDWSYTASLVNPASPSILWDDEIQDEENLDIDPEVLNARLRALRDELGYPVKKPLNVILDCVSDAVAWIVGKIKLLFDTILESDQLLSMAIYICLMAIVYSMSIIIESISTKNKKEVNKGFSIESKMASYFSIEDLGTYHQSIVNNLREVTVLNEDNKLIHVIGLLSGHSVLLPSHAVITPDNIKLTVFKDKVKNHIIYDKLSVSVVYMNREQDVCVVRLPKTIPTVFRKIANFGKDVGGKLSLLTPFGKYDSCQVTQVDSSKPILYSIPLLNNYTVTVKGENFTYDVHGDGLCGAVVCNNFGILGMHVAGNDKLNMGLAMKWSDEVRFKINEIFQLDAENFAFDMSPKTLENMSVLKLDVSLNASVGSKSNLSTTPLYGLYPVTRFPANLTKYGKCTVKDIAKKSFQHTVNVSSSDLNFGKRVVRRFLQDSKFKILPEKEIVGGNELLAGLNKDSSNGYGCLKEKTEYIDFENKCYTELLRSDLQKFEEDFGKGIIDWQKLVWCEALKDELRNEEKEGIPRSFRVGTIHHQILMKKYFGWLVEHLMINRKYNNICVGINPIKEWPIMYEELRACKGVFAGDIAKWDGSMNNLVQDAIVEVILEFTPKEHKDIVELLLANAVRSLVAIQDDVYVTTHSMPSGHYLTAILNSLVNRFYTAIWYNREIGDNNVNKFIHSIIDFVYGDDKLVGIKDNVDRLNAISMRDFFLSMGMGFTDSLKGDIIAPFQSLDEVTFLKRFFRFHDELGRIVCPLELRTLQSGISFYDRTKDLSVVLRAKIENYQREAYLWPDRDILLQDMAIKLKDRGYSDYILSRSYLKQLYEDPDEFLKDLTWGSSRYI